MSHRIPVDTKIWHFRVSPSNDNQKIIEAWKNINDLKSLWFGKSTIDDKFVGFIEFEKEEDYEVMETMFFFIDGDKEFKPFYISLDSLYEYMLKRNQHVLTRKKRLSDLAMADI